MELIVTGMGGPRSETWTWQIAEMVRCGEEKLKARA